MREITFVLLIYIVTFFLQLFIPWRSQAVPDEILEYNSSIQPYRQFFCFQFFESQILLIRSTRIRILCFVRWPFLKFKEITDHAVPLTTKRRQSSGWVSFKSCKISNMTVEIVRIHEDYVTTTSFTLMSMVPHIFETDRRNVKKKKVFASVLKIRFINEIHLRGLPYRFLRRRLSTNSFFIISDPTSTETKYRSIL